MLDRSILGILGLQVRHRLRVEIRRRPWHGQATPFHTALLEKTHPKENTPTRMSQTTKASTQRIRVSAKISCYLPTRNAVFPEACFEKRNAPGKGPYMGVSQNRGTKKDVLECFFLPVPFQTTKGHPQTNTHTHSHTHTPHTHLPHEADWAEHRLETTGGTSLSSQRVASVGQNQPFNSDKRAAWGSPDVAPSWHSAR